MVRVVGQGADGRARAPPTPECAPTRAAAAPAVRARPPPATSLSAYHYDGPSLTGELVHRGRRRLHRRLAEPPPRRGSTGSPRPCTAAPASATSTGTTWSGSSQTTVYAGRQPPRASTTGPTRSSTSREGVATRCNASAPFRQWKWWQRHGRVAPEAARPAGERTSSDPSIPTGRCSSAPGGPEAFGEFYDRHWRRSLRWYLAHTRSAHTAVELAAETFAQALASVAPLRPRPGHGRIVALRHRRAPVPPLPRGGARSTAAPGAACASPPPSSPTTTWSASSSWPTPSAASPQLDAPSAQLSDGVRAAVELRVGHDLPYAEVAARLGCTELGAAPARPARGSASSPSRWWHRERARPAPLRRPAAGGPHPAPHRAGGSVADRVPRPSRPPSPPSPRGCWSALPGAGHGATCASRSRDGRVVITLVDLEHRPDHIEARAPGSAWTRPVSARRWAPRRWAASWAPWTPSGSRPSWTGSTPGPATFGGFSCRSGGPGASRSASGGRPGPASRTPSSPTRSPPASRWPAATCSGGPPPTWRRCSPSLALSVLVADRPVGLRSPEALAEPALREATGGRHRRLAVDRVVLRLGPPCSPTADHHLTGVPQMTTASPARCHLDLRDSAPAHALALAVRGRRLVAQSRGPTPARGRRGRPARHAPATGRSTCW